MFEFFIKRPIFSCVLSIVIVLTGLVCLLKLPTDIFPPITPPTILINASYTGASVDTLSKTVAAPVEVQVNGVEDMLYMVTNNTNTGELSTTVTFGVDSDIDMNLVNTLNRVNLAMPKLPPEVKAVGVNVDKKSTSILQLLVFRSPHQNMSLVDLTAYIDVNVLDPLKRIDGVGKAQLIGAPNAIRIWLDPNKLAKLSLAAGDVIQAVREQNNQYATGRIGIAPFTDLQEKNYGIVAKGRLATPQEFENIILKATSSGEVVRLKDVGRVERGFQNYDFVGKLNGEPVVVLSIYLQPGANALAVAQKVREEMHELAQRFPKGVEYLIPYDTTKFIEVSIEEVVHTLFEATFLVFLVVYLFLQNWRATIIPTIAVPVCLMGCLIGLAALGFSINTLTLFGMVLSIGIVVDDAIVVVENVERLMHEEKLSPIQASIKAMKEVGGPVIAIVLILCAVFVPVSFLGGLIGQLYRQFATTIAIAVVFSGIVALTLSPSLSALLLKQTPHTPNRFFQAFNAGFEKLQTFYVHGVRYLLNRPFLGGGLFTGVLVACFFLGKMVPGSLVPDEDQGYLIMLANSVPGTTTQKTEKLATKLDAMIQEQPAVDHVLSLSGFDLLSGQRNPSTLTTFMVLKDWNDRKERHLKAPAVLKDLSQKLMAVPEALAFVFNPPTIPGLGAVGGVECYLEDRGGRTSQELEDLTQQFIQEAEAHPAIARISTTLRTSLPLYKADLDLPKIKSLGVPVDQLFATLSAYYGGYYVNDYNEASRIYQVYIQAEDTHRLTTDNLKQMYVRSATTHAMIPLDALVTLRPESGPILLNRFNGTVAAYVNGVIRPGFTSGQAIGAMEKIAKEKMPQDIKLSWAGSAFQEKQVGSQSIIAILFGIIMVMLILSALYERVLLPISVLCAIPFGVLGALFVVFLTGLSNDIYFQIGLLTLVGLSAKNAILIVEFAIVKREEGLDVIEAAVEAARLRLRPIIMTSLAFILGAVPLVLSSGAGANGRHSIGAGLIGGMISSSSLALFFIPLFYVLFQKLSEKLKTKKVSTTKGKPDGKDPHA